MATCTEQVSLVDTGAATSYTTASFTPPAGSLLVLVATSSGFTPGASYWHVNDSESATDWTRIQYVQADINGGTYERLIAFARTAPVSGAPMTVTTFNTGATFSDMLLCVVSVDGMALMGGSAFLQGASRIGSPWYTSGVPYADFATAPHSANPIIGFIANTADPVVVGTTPPTGFTQAGHGAVTSPANAISVCFIDGGHTDTHVGWNGSSCSRYQAAIFELDTTGGIPWIPPPDTVDPIWINSFEIKVLTGR